MKEKPREYGKLAAIVVVTIILYIYIVHPFLLDVAPFLAFQSSDGFERRSGGLGPFSLAATVLAGIFFYYVVIEYTIKVGFVPLLAVIGMFILILIPNLFLPERFHPENMNDLQDLEDRYKEKPGLVKRSFSYIRKIISRQK
ncbi:hypothetical protein [Halocatena marina]|uniref:hypothetical protein n=1 Tax=Halocatena marina TaxID=2934937 RepID=UPI00200F18FD|nr:hypothetical protein [Halocatena marina]